MAFHDPIDAIGWALHVQLALLEAPWPPELLQQPQAKLETCQDGKLLFRGLRVRMAINTGVPAGIIVGQVSSQQCMHLGSWSALDLLTRRERLSHDHTTS